MCSSFGRAYLSGLDLVHLVEFGKQTQRNDPQKKSLTVMRISEEIFFIFLIAPSIWTSRLDSHDDDDDDYRFWSVIHNTLIDTERASSSTNYPSQT